MIVSQQPGKQLNWLVINNQLSKRLDMALFGPKMGLDFCFAGCYLPRYLHMLFHRSSSIDMLHLQAPSLLDGNV